MSEKCKNCPENCSGDCENCEAVCDGNCEDCKQACGGDCENCSEKCDSGCSGDCESCGKGCASQSRESLLEAPHRLSQIKKVIAVVSGKGGVGKSMVTSALAVTMRRRGLNVGILDADITGPSIPNAFGLTEQARGNDDGILPVFTKEHISVMSVNLLLENSTDPVVWRGPVIAGAVKQFWTDVIWGDLDYLFVDMPPGTGDVPLTVFQSLPVDGIVVVTSPQELVGMIVEKAVNMAGLLDVPVLALVENMSYFRCPDCGKEHHIFGESHLEEIAERHGIPQLFRLPISPALAAAMDQGRIGEIAETGLESIEL
jgi:Mrp family chromosome partitioning ATPase